MEKVLDFPTPENTVFAGEVDYQVGVYALAATLIARMRADADLQNDTKMLSAAAQLEECFALLVQSLDWIRADTPMPHAKKKARLRSRYVIESNWSNVRIEVRVQWFAHRAFVSQIRFRLRRKPQYASQYMWRKIFSVLLEPRTIKLCRYMQAS